ncbi:MAG TPA: hypothetical protein VHT73_09135 [Thermodesulfobacteriota bacterium]|nr:hypothetical protein [Thermodesulfobacteriota bacterium]
MEEIKGTVEKVNPKGIRVDGRWYNYSKYIEEEIPEVNEGDKVKIDVKGDWIMKFKLLSRESFGENKRENFQMPREKRETDRQVVITRLACLNTATEILKLYSKPITSKNLFKVAEELESWVWRNLREENTESIDDPEFEDLPKVNFETKENNSKKATT